MSSVLGSSANAADWLTAFGTLGAVIVALGLALLDRYTRRKEGAERNASRVIVDRLPATGKAGVADWKVSVQIRNFSGEPLRAVEVHQDWLTGYATQVQPSTHITDNGRHSVVFLNHLRPNEHEVWIEFGANRRENADAPPLPGRSYVRWVDRHGTRWETEPSGLPRRIKP